MKTKLIFDDWRRNGKSVYNADAGIALSLGDFHSGTIFSAEIELTAEQEDELRANLENGYEPVFYMVKV